MEVEWMFLLAIENETRVTRCSSLPKTSFLAEVSVMTIFCGTAIRSFSSFFTIFPFYSSFSSVSRMSSAAFSTFLPHFTRISREPFKAHITHYTQVSMHSRVPFKALPALPSFRSLFTFSTNIRKCINDNRKDNH
ncbi:hypothetical protein FHG87_011044 [Trinorchestia longiramus]|nr:hypothetical protein FHG87_011044 [Trinorchestia longiramus]